MNLCLSSKTQQSGNSERSPLPPSHRHYAVNCHRGSSSFKFLFCKGLSWLYCVKSNKCSWLDSMCKDKHLLFLKSRSKMLPSVYHLLRCFSVQLTIALSLHLASKQLPLFQGLQTQKHLPPDVSF